MSRRRTDYRRLAAPPALSCSFAWTTRPRTSWTNAATLRYLTMCPYAADTAGCCLSHWTHTNGACCGHGGCEGQILHSTYSDLLPRFPVPFTSLLRFLSVGMYPPRLQTHSMMPPPLLSGSLISSPSIAAASAVCTRIGSGYLAALHTHRPVLTPPLCPRLPHAAGARNRSRAAPCTLQPRRRAAECWQHLLDELGAAVRLDGRCAAAEPGAR